MDFLMHFPSFMHFIRKCVPIMHSNVLEKDPKSHAFDCIAFTLFLVIFDNADLTYDRAAIFFSFFVYMSGPRRGLSTL